MAQKHLDDRLVQIEKELARVQLSLISKLRVAQTAELLFRDGWFFLVPYSGLFGLCQLFDVPVPKARFAFWILHGFVLLLGVTYAHRRLRHADRFDFLFWIALFLLFLIPGAYLEYPADPWEHFRRILSWSTPSIATVRQQEPEACKPAYFLAWSFIGFIEISWRRWALDFYSAIMQALIAVQVFRLSMSIGASRLGAWAQIAGFFLLFGTNLFSFRYYALAGTAVAFATYLGLLRTMLHRYYQGEWQSAWKLPFGVLVMALNHSQEVLFTILAVATLGIWWLARRTPRNTLILVVLGLALLNVLLGLYLKQQNPSPFVRPHFDENSFSFFGTYRIWRLHSPFLETLGVFGVVSLALAIWRFRVCPPVAVLTLAPIVLLQSVPFVLWSLKNFNYDYVAYRVLFLMPWSFFLIRVLEEGWKTARHRASKWGPAILLVVGSAVPFYPLRGKAYFQFHRPKGDRALTAQDETAQWLHRHRSPAEHCRYLTDDPTGYALGVHLQLPVNRDRLYPERRLWNLNAEVAQSLFNQPNRPCGLLVADPSQLPTPSPSRIGSWSRHWDTAHSEPRWQVPDKILERLQPLNDAGWTMTRVPPYYFLYEPPK